MTEENHIRLECLKLANANAQIEHGKRNTWEPIDQKTMIEKAEQMFNYVVGNDWQNVDVRK